MTAEIVVVNAHGIALAADSAATIYGTKVYNSANKLFALSKYEPIAIMIYGASALVGVPWEVLIKEFRAQLHRSHHNTLVEYSDRFWEYVRSRKDIFTSEIQIPPIVGKLWNFYTNIVEPEIQEIIGELEGEPGEPEYLNAFRGKIDELLTGLNTKIAGFEVLPDFENMPAEDLIATYQQAFEESTTELQPIKSEMTAEQTKNLYRCGAELLRRNFFDTSSGVVFAGYGRSEIQPQISSFQVGIFVNDILRFQPLPALSNVNGGPFRPDIYPFAQDEMVISFVHGVSRSAQQRLQNNFDQITSQWKQDIINALQDSGTSVNEASEAALEELLTSKRETMLAELDTCKQESMFPIIEMLGHLQKDELAEMAESLVNLTAFKRKMSKEMESVGGPIDVAVISKGDGFIWVKRKHYFKPELNQAFFNNYFDYRGITDEQED